MLNSFLKSAIGVDEDFDLYSQIFHRIMLLSGLALLTALLLSFFIDIPEVSIMLFATLIVLSISFWLSRVLNKFRLALVVFYTTAHALLLANFFYNNGINGSTTIIGLLVLSVVFSISNKREKWFWAIFQMLLLSGLILYQYQYGDEHIIGYPDKLSAYVDEIFTYFIAVGFLSLIFQVIIRKNRLQRKDLILREREIRDQRDQLAKSNENLYKLMSLIAHDVRNPLASIESYLDPETQALINDEDRVEFNRELLALVRNTSHMLDETLHWSRSQFLEHDNSIVHLKNAAIGTWVNNTIVHLKSMAKSKQIVIIDDYDGSIHLNCDSNLLTVVLRNILQNAIKFSEPKSSIIFKAWEDQEKVHFEIKDSGVGMKQSTIDKIISGKAETTPGTAQEKGTGLGLQVSLEYIKLHKGELKINSKPQVGSRFQISIPKGLS